MLEKKLLKTSSKFPPSFIYSNDVQTDIGVSSNEKHLEQHFDFLESKKKETNKFFSLK